MAVLTKSAPSLNHASPASRTGSSKRPIWQRIAAKILEVVAILTLVFAYLQVAVAAGWPPFDPTSQVKIEHLPDGYQIGDGDLTLRLTGNLAKPYTHIWLVSQDETGLWYPLSEAFSRPEDDSWDSRIRREQLGDDRQVDITLHAVMTDDQGSSDLSVARTTLKGLASLPLVSVSSDHRLIHS